MRNILSGLAMAASFSCFGQQTFNVQILSIVDSLPVPGSLIKIDNKKLITSDSLGSLTILTTKRKIRLTLYSAINQVDTVVYIKSISTPIKIFIPARIDSALAVYHIKHNKLLLFCGGGIAPLAPMPSDKIFEALYLIKYHLLDCSLPPLEELYSYNKIVADYLDKKYGNEWRQKVRPDVFYVTRKVRF